LLKIADVEKNSPAWYAGLRAGCSINTINGNRVRDVLDFKFYGSEETLEIDINKGAASQRVVLHRKGGAELGILPSPMKIRKCANHCIFCFMDQLPRGMRSSLYIKDEDFRFSFLHGNFVTLANLPSSRLNRIITQSLSPLYVSVHATDTGVRRKLLGIRERVSILDTLSALVKGGIKLHTQIVLVPGINTGRILRKTVEDLAGLYPGVLSIGIIPIGLTRHRRGLEPLRTFTGARAGSIIEYVHKLSKKVRDKGDQGFIYLADEWFLMAGRDIPRASYYADFPQLENGIGMVRLFLDKIDSLKPDRTRAGRKWISIVTGLAAKPYIISATKKLAGRFGNRYTVHPVKNNFLGSRITVSGLLTGRDIVSQLSAPLAPTVLVPPNLFNEQGRTLDDWDLDMLSGALQRRVKVAKSVRELI
jgi:putative radical SAM enzyme (TIGR03279 family)